MDDDGARHAHFDPRADKRVQLVADEINLRREVPEDEGEDGDPIGLILRDGPEEREHQEEKRKQREQ